MNTPQFYYLYILKSQKTGKLYIGQTQNLEERLSRHNQGREKYTRKGLPWMLLYAKTFKERRVAMMWERKLKSWKSPKRVLAWIEREKLINNG